jgi:phosphoribosylanthranilate isomerase
MTQIKICGLTRPEDAVAAWEAGADRLGLILAPSRRCVSLEQARRVVAALPPQAAVVGVFVNASLAAMRRVASELRLCALQLHGDEPVACCCALGPRVIKAVRPRYVAQLAQVEAYQGFDLLLDAWSAQAPGGTGALSRWTWARDLVQRGHRLILSGGLTPDNVHAAVLAVRPRMVDVSTGVEARGTVGRKDVGRMRAFVDAVRAADGVLTAG